MDYYLELRAQASFLTHDELDLVLMASIMSTILTDDVVWCRHKPAKRSRIRLLYMHNGHTICKTTFMFLHGVRKKRLLAVKDSYNNNGLETRVHKNRKSLPHNYRSLEVIKNFVPFLQNYCEENAILLPGRIPGFKRDDIKLLPSSQSKKVLSVHCCKFSFPFLILDHLDILQKIMSEFQGVCSSLNNILFILAGTSPIHCCGETNERPLLDMPVEQQFDHEGSQ